MSEQALTATVVRESLEAIPDLTLPSGVTDGILDRRIEQKTAVVLAWRGRTSLPTTGQLERDLINDAVEQLTVRSLQRDLRPDEEEYQRALNEADKHLERSLRIVENSSPRSGFRFDVTGGVEG